MEKHLEISNPEKTEGYIFWRNERRIVLSWNNLYSVC